MGSAHLNSVKAAERTNKVLLQLFYAMGTSDHPRGQIVAAYRNARRSLDEIARRGSLVAVRDASEALDSLRRDVALAASDILDKASQTGISQARAEMAAYDVQAARFQAPAINQAHSAWMATVDEQLANAKALVSSRADWALVLGDAERAGVLRPGPVVQAGARWITITAMDALQAMLQPAFEFDQRKIVYKKQAIAAIDERTTDCCLRVHAQVVTFDANFHLSGTPRYADELPWSPFHGYCRTSVATVADFDADDDLTRRMREAAQFELQARAAVQAQIDDVAAQLGRLGAVASIRETAEDSAEVRRLRRELRRLRSELLVEIHPASATSGRND